MFGVIDWIEELALNVQELIHLFIGFFDLIVQAFKSVYFLWDFLNMFFSYVPGEVSAVVVMSVLGAVGAFVMW